MRPEDYNEDSVHKLFDIALKRKNTNRVNKLSMGTLIMLAKNGGYNAPQSIINVTHSCNPKSNPFNLNDAIPSYYENGVPKREFAGPSAGEAQLFPMNAITLLVALGGVGKTTAIVKWAAHIAAGKNWGSENIQRRKVMIFAVEESKQELDRKFSASIHIWKVPEKITASENLRLISCQNIDSRLTSINGRNVAETELVSHIIDTTKEFGAEVIFLDHLQGFVSGDLNISDTATSIARLSNRIVSETGAAVVIAAHISKSNINATEVLNGFTTGSLAFENAARQVVGIIPLPDEDAKKFGLEQVKNNYNLIGMPKNSYGPSGQKFYISKQYMPDFHTITIEPYTPPIGKIIIPTASERLKDSIVDFVKNNPDKCSKNKIELGAGKKGKFKASRNQVRTALAELVEDGVLQLKALTQKERASKCYPHQVKEIYVYAG